MKFESFESFEETEKLLPLSLFSHPSNDSYAREAVDPMSIILYYYKLFLTKGGFFF